MGVCYQKSNLKQRLNDQDKKLNDLKKINEQLQNHFSKFQETEFNVLLKQTIDTTNDITNLRTIFDTKFNKIEKTVERIHLDLKRSFHEIEMQNNNEVILKITIPEKSARKEENDDKEIEKSLSLNFEKENNEIMDKKAEMTPKLSKEMGIINGNELIIPKKEDNKSFLTINEIHMEMEEKPSHNNSCAIVKKDQTINLKYILEDEKINKIYSGVKNKMFKNLKNT